MNKLWFDFFMYFLPQVMQCFSAKVHAEPLHLHYQCFDGSCNHFSSKSSDWNYLRTSSTIFDRFPVRRAWNTFADWPFSQTFLILWQFCKQLIFSLTIFAVLFFLCQAFLFNLKVDYGWWVDDVSSFFCLLHGEFKFSNDMDGLGVSWVWVSLLTVCGGETTSLSYTVGCLMDALESSSHFMLTFFFRVPCMQTFPPTFPLRVLHIMTTLSVELVLLGIMVQINWSLKNGFAMICHVIHYHKLNPITQTDAFSCLSVLNMYRAFLPFYLATTERKVVPQRLNHLQIIQEINRSIDLTLFQWCLIFYLGPNLTQDT